MLRACVYLYSSAQCVVGTLDIVSKILKFPYKLFWIMISKEENQFAPTLEKVIGAKESSGLVKHNCTVERVRLGLKAPGWELWFHQ